MNQTTLQKIARHRDALFKLHKSKKKLAEYIAMLDEPYILALKIMDEPKSKTDQDIAADLNCHWNTVKQIRPVLDI